MEYNFYMPETEVVDKNSEKLITEEDPELDSGDDFTDNEPIDDEGFDSGDSFDDDSFDEDDEFEEDSFDEDSFDEDDEFEDDFEEDMDSFDEEIPEEPAGDEVEVDVTEIVTATDEAKESASQAEESAKSAEQYAQASNIKMDQLLKQFNNLAVSVKKMDQISNKIDNLDRELEKRAPTPEEQLELRSLSSYPYNVKLTDYWDQKEGIYDVDKKTEYVLTDEDIQGDMNMGEIKDSFDLPEDEMY